MTKEQSGDTNLQGHDYFIHEGDDPDAPEDLYVWQECGTAVAVDLVDSTQRQWAYVRWIRTGEDRRRPLYCQAADAGRCGVPRGGRGFAQPGRFRELRFSGGRLRPLYPAVPVDELFSLGLSGQWDSASEDVPGAIILSARDGTGEVVDLRDGAEAVETFIAAHEKNPVERPLQLSRPDSFGL